MSVVCVQHDKIMAGGNLENIMNRLNGCLALLDALYVAADCSVFSEEAIEAVHDLLEAIYKDFKADIEAAEDYSPEDKPAPTPRPVP